MPVSDDLVEVTAELLRSTQGRRLVTRVDAPLAPRASFGLDLERTDLVADPKGISNGLCAGRRGDGLIANGCEERPGTVGRKNLIGVMPRT